MAGLRSVDTQIDSTKRKLEELTAAALGARAAMAGMSPDTEKFAADLEAMKTRVSGLERKFVEADEAGKRVGVSDTQITKVGVMAHEAAKLRDRFIEADIASRGGGGGGGFGDGKGNPYGSPLGGILPGGSRARPAALLTLLGLGGAAAVGAGPGVLGLGAAALPAAVEGLVGGALTLKLAFSGITKAAFTTQKAFDKLDPAQQQFVQSLRSIDAGFIKPLEKLAQTNLFPKLVDSLRLALSPSAVGAVRGAVGGFSNAIGGGVVDLGHLFGSAGFASNFGAVMQADARYLKVFIDAFGNLLDALFVFQRAAIPFTDWLSKSFAGLTQWVDAALKADAANGRLAHFFDMAKTSLQALGGLFMSVAHFAGAFADAVGFQNGLGVINLLRDAINDISDTLHKDSHVLREFFGGALGSARDLLNVTKSLFDNVITPLLSGINKLVGGMRGWRVAIDLVAAGFVLLKIQALISIEAIQAALTSAVFLATAGLAAIAVAVGLATVYIITHWSQVTKGIQLLWKAAVQAVEGMLNGMVYAFLSQFKLITAGLAKAFGWVPFFGKELKGINSEFSAWVDSFATNAANHFHNAGMLGSEAFRAGFSSGLGGPTGNLGPVGTPGHTGPPVGSAGPTKFSSLLNLPPALDAAVKAANSGHGDIAKANEAAYAYYEGILKIATTQAQKTAVYTAEAQYVSSSAFGTPGALDQTGMPKPPHPAGVNLLSQGIQQRLATAQGNDATSTLATARALKAVDMAAQTYLEHLRASGVSQKEISAIDRELTTLKREQARAQREINKGLKKQAIDAAHNQIDALLGISHGDGSTNVQAFRNRERSTLLQIAKRAKITDVDHGSISDIIHALQQHGITFSPTAIKDFQNMQKAIEIASKTGAKITSEESSKQIALLKQIKDNTDPKNMHANTYHLPSVAELMKGLKGTPSERKALAQKLVEIEALGGKIPSGPTALGLPTNGVPPKTVQDHIKALYALSNAHGLITRGNLDINHRKVVHNPDGSISTEESITIGLKKGVFALIPTVFNGMHHTFKQAIAHYMHTKQSLGLFDSEKDADTYAVRLHNRQSKFYGAGASGSGNTFIDKVEIMVSGTGKGAQELAAEIRRELTKTARRNPTQVRGPNAGRNIGHN